MRNVVHGLLLACGLWMGALGVLGVWGGHEEPVGREGRAFVLFNGLRAEHMPDGWFSGTGLEAFRKARPGAGYASVDPLPLERGAHGGEVPLYEDFGEGVGALYYFKQGELVGLTVFCCSKAALGAGELGELEGAIAAVAPERRVGEGEVYVGEGQRSWSPLVCWSEGGAEVRVQVVNEQHRLGRGAVYFSAERGARNVELTRERGAGSGERGTWSGERGIRSGERKRGAGSGELKRERGAGSGERGAEEGAGSGERGAEEGAGSGERGAGSGELTRN